MNSRATMLLVIVWAAGILLAALPSSAVAGASRPAVPRSVNTGETIDLSTILRTGGSPAGTVHEGTGAVLTVPVPYATITAAIAAAGTGDIIQIAAGTYTENVIINKSVTIDGAGAALTTIHPAVSDVGGCGGPSLGNSQVMVVSAHGVTISNLTIDGDNPSLTSGTVVNGADLDARNGIIESDGPWNNLVVHHTVVKNIYLRAIYARSGGTGFNIHDNVVQNVAACYASIAIFNFGGSGTIAANTVSNANDAIAANWSRGTQFLNNIITASGSGVHTDNNGGFGGVADLIQGNNVSNSTVGGYGVWVFFPYLNATVNSNTVTNVDVGVFAWGGAGGTAAFTNNIVNGQNKPGSFGAYMTVGPDAWASYQSNLAATMSGNTIQNNSYGYAIETDETAPYFSLNVSVATPTTSGNVTDIYASGLGSITTSGLTGNTVFVNAPAKVQDGVNVASAGGTVTLSPGTFDVTALLPLNKANLKLQGSGSTLTTLQVSGSGERFGVTASGVTMQDLDILKTDKTGVQNIIYVGASNFTLKNSVVHGQFVIGDGEVSRAMVVSAGLSGLQIEGNTFYALRQPGYFSGPTTGNITNNFIYRTKGWVMEGGDMTFTGNTWGVGAQTNVYDIVILSMAPPTAYTDIVAMSNANNGAVIEDQRVSPAVLSVVYVDAATSFSSDLGGRYHPYATIPPAITRVVTGGTIFVAPGSYADAVVLTKHLTLDGAGSGSTPATNTVIAGPGSGTGISTVAGVSPSVRVVLKDLYVTNWFTGVVANSYLTLDNVAAEYNPGAGSRGLELSPLQDLVITNCRFDNNGIGMRAGTAANIAGMTITGSTFNGNVQGWFIAMGGAANSSTMSNVTVTGTTFNNNLQKGIYVEKLEDAVFDGITVANSGIDPAYGFNNGIDINLKYGTYQNIQFLNSSITGSGVMGTATDPTNPAAVAVKARDDAPSYNTVPATLDNVVFNNCTIAGPENALRLGEFGKVNNTPTNLVVTNSTINGAGTGKYHVINRTAAAVSAYTGNTYTGSTTLAEKEAKILHKPDLPALGIVDYGQYAVTGSEVWVDASWAGTLPGTPVGGHWFGTDAFATIQAGVNAVMAPGIVHVADGTYPEAVLLNKVVQLLGGGAATVVNPGSSSLDAITVAANGLTVSGFTLTGGKNGVYGTTASSSLKQLTISGNAQNGIALVNADYNAIQGNTIAGHAAGVGILLSGSKQNTVSGNTVQSNGVNVQVDINGTRAARGNLIQGNTLKTPGTWSVNITNEPKTTLVNFNVFSAPDKYIRNASASQLLNAQYNWFGGETSPGPGAPDFSGAVDFSHNYATDPTVSVFPSSYYLPTGTTVTLNVMAMLPAGVYARGVDATLQWTRDDLLADLGDPVEGSFFATFPSRMYLFDRPTGSSVRVNSAILGPTSGAGNAPGGMPYVGTVFSQEFDALAEGTSVLTLSGIQLRDPANNPITPVVIDPPGGSSITVDGTAPSVTATFIDNTTLDNDNFIKNTDNVTVTATVTDLSPLSLTDITADLSGFYGGSGHTADNPASYVGGLATWTVSGVVCAPANGPITATVSVTDPAGNSAAGTDNITADNIAPAAATGLVAKTVSPGGHQNVALNWTAGSDANYRGVVVRYNGWSYPTYPVGSTPAYPPTPAAGTGVTASPLAGTSTTHAIPGRNVYYYSVFAVDWAGNYSTLDPSGTDRAANYYLGDLGSGTGTYIPGSGGYNGQVNYEDLFWFSRLYFSTYPGWTALDPNAPEGDFGPTLGNKTYAANHRFGIARPDGRIDFEDLMIFSMNYNNVAPRIAPPEGTTPATELAVELRGTTVAMRAGNQYAVTVHIANDGRSLKGTSVALRYDPAVMVPEVIAPAGIFAAGQQAFFAYREDQGAIRMDGAILGTGRTLDFPSDLAVVQFRALQSGTAQVTLASAEMRDAENQDLEPALRDVTTEQPAAFALQQNYPNPFNPATVIEYALPQEARVTLKVYNTLGQEVATLVDEVQTAGFKSVSWNGKDLASGVYFYRIKAGEFTDLRRMILMK